MEKIQNKIPMVPSGRMLVKVFPNLPPEVEISGVIETKDIQLSLMSIRKAFAQYLQALGEANKIKQCEIERLKKIEEDKTKEG